MIDNVFLFFLALLITLSRSKVFWAIPSVGRKAFCRSFKFRFDTSRLARILWKSLVITLLMVIGLHEASLESGSYDSSSIWSEAFPLLSTS